MSSTTRELPLDHLLSFVTHDVYAPASMLRTYLQAVHQASSADESLREMVADAEGLARELEGLVRLLQDRLRLALDRVSPKEGDVALAAFVGEWARGRPHLQWEGDEGDAAVRADESVLVRVLEDFLFQLRRMGSRQGDVSVSVRGATVRLWRADGAITREALEQALFSPDEDWSSNLRRLPASGLPLRVAKGLVESLGGKVQIQGETGEGPAVEFHLPVAPSVT